MKVQLRTLQLAMVVLLLFQLASAQAPKLSPFSADMHMSSTRSDHGSSNVSGKMYVGSGHMRINMETAGNEVAMISDFATNTTYILMIQQHMYMENKAGEMQKRGPGSMTQDLKPYDPEHPCANQPGSKCKKIGVEEINGRTCDHWEFTDKQGRVSNAWIDNKMHFPVKFASQDSTMTLTNIKEGEPDSSLFQIPAGFKKLTMPDGAPSGMGRPQQQ